MNSKTALRIHGQICINDMLIRAIEEAYLDQVCTQCNQSIEFGSAYYYVYPKGDRLHHGCIDAYLNFNNRIRRD